MCTYSIKYPFHFLLYDKDSIHVRKWVYTTVIDISIIKENTNLFKKHRYCYTFRVEPTGDFEVSKPDICKLKHYNSFHSYRGNVKVSELGVTGVYSNEIRYYNNIKLMHFKFGYGIIELKR